MAAPQMSFLSCEIVRSCLGRKKQKNLAIWGNVFWDAWAFALFHPNSYTSSRGCGGERQKYVSSIIYWAQHHNHQEMWFKCQISSQGLKFPDQRRQACPLNRTFIFMTSSWLWHTPCPASMRPYKNGSKNKGCLWSQEWLMKRSDSFMTFHRSKFGTVQPFIFGEGWTDFWHFRTQTASNMYRKI